MRYGELMSRSFLTSDFEEETRLLANIWYFLEHCDNNQDRVHRIFDAACEYSERKKL